MNLQPRYGIDAPGVVRTCATVGPVLVLPEIVDLSTSGIDPLPHLLNVACCIIGTSLLGYAVVMIWSSLVGKLRVRDRLVNALALVGSERVLDAGCGKGLALIGCAKRLTTGRAIGIDLWEHRDLSANNADATRRNAVAEGVADRVDVETGDITRLAFESASFDCIVSMTVLHNIPSETGREQAVLELVRVLKPGGRLAIFDLDHIDDYVDVLRSANLAVNILGWHLLWLWPCRSLLALKPAS